MYRVVIADDEPWALYRVQSLIEQAQLGFEIVGTAGDGQTALELVEREHPALLLSDIRMPGLDGLQLVRKMKHVSPQTLAIMITGFSDFAYAVDALRQGVFDYLVKPIKKDHLTQVLERALQRLAEQDAPGAYDAYFALFGGGRPVSIREACALAGITDPLPCGILASLTLEKPFNAPLIHLQEGVRPSVCFRTGRSKLTLLIQAEASGVSFLPCELLPESTLYTGISASVSMDESFQAAFRQSEVAMFTALMRGTSAPYVYTTAPSPMAATLRERFLLALNQQDQDAMLSVLSQLRSVADSLQFDELLKLSNHFTAQMTEHRFGEYEALELHHLHQVGTEHLLEALITPIEHAIRQHEEQLHVAPSQMHRILQTIDESCTQEIKLSDLSKRFYLTANYMSILIKKETGMTFSEIVIRKRISIAKKLLIETDAAIQDVMEQVGYRDYSSFIKLFQKHVGCTPYAYRKDAQRHGEEKGQK